MARGVTAEVSALRKACRIARAILEAERESLIDGYSEGATHRRKDVRCQEGLRAIRPIERALAAINEALPPRRKSPDA